MSSTLYFASMPCSCNAIAAFSAVWPPRVGKYRIGLFLQDDRLNCSRNRFNVGRIGEIWIGYNRRGI